MGCSNDADRHRLEELENKIQSLEAQPVNTNNQPFPNKLKEIEECLAALSAKIPHPATPSPRELEKVKNDVDLLNKSLDLLKQQIPNSLPTSSNSLSSSVDPEEFNKKIAALEHKLAAANTQVEDLIKKAGQEQAKSTKLEQKLEQRLKELENKLLQETQDIHLINEQIKQTEENAKAEANHMLEEAKKKVQEAIIKEAEAMEKSKEKDLQAAAQLVKEVVDKKITQLIDKIAHTQATQKVFTRMIPKLLTGQFKAKQAISALKDKITITQEGLAQLIQKLAGNQATEEAETKVVIDSLRKAITGLEQAVIDLKQNNVEIKNELDKKMNKPFAKSK
jgi:chromosome segregation ATPase